MKSFAFIIEKSVCLMWVLERSFSLIQTSNDDDRLGFEDIEMFETEMYAVSSANVRTAKMSGKKGKNGRQKCIFYTERRRELCLGKYLLR